MYNGKDGTVNVPRFRETSLDKFKQNGGMKTQSTKKRKKAISNPYDKIVGVELSPKAEALMRGYFKQIDR